MRDMKKQESHLNREAMNEKGNASRRNGLLGTRAKIEISTEFTYNALIETSRD